MEQSRISLTNDFTEHVDTAALLKLITLIYVAIVHCCSVFGQVGDIRARPSKAEPTPLSRTSRRVADPDARRHPRWSRICAFNTRIQIRIKRIAETGCAPIRASSARTNLYTTALCCLFRRGWLV